MADRKQIHALTHQEGQSFWMLGTLMTLKASAATTNGAFSLIEQVAPPGFATPLHVHHAEDLAFYVLEGEVTFFGGGETIHAPVGTYVYLPRDLPWSFRVAGSLPTRL